MTDRQRLAFGRKYMQHGRSKWARKDFVLKELVVVI